MLLRAGMSVKKAPFFNITDLVRAMFPRRRMRRACRQRRGHEPVGARLHRRYLRLPLSIIALANMSACVVQCGVCLTAVLLPD